MGAAHEQIVIDGGVVFSGSDLLAPARITVDGATIAGVDPSPHAGPSPDAGVRFDASERLVTPGWINAHTHAYSALARGIALKDPAPADFRQTLERLWWRLDRTLTLSDVELSALLHGIECLRHGVTTVFDHHASQSAVTGSLRTLADAWETLGLRACLCFEVSDRDGSEAAQAGIDENLAFIRSCDSEKARLRARFGLHASLTLSDETLARCAGEPDARSAGFHLHVAEDAIDQRDARERYGCSVVERLARAGVLTPRTICVHGVHLDEHDTRLLAESGAWLAHCAQSNMNNAVGAASLPALQRAGVKLALGTDGFTAAVLTEALVAHLLQSHTAGDPRAGYSTVPGLLLDANARLASETFGLAMGRLAPGAAADLVVWDYRPPTPITGENFWGHVLFGLAQARAEEVWIGGRHVFSRGAPVAVDETDVRRRCRAAAEGLWERF